MYFLRATFGSVLFALVLLTMIVGVARVSGQVVSAALGDITWKVGPPVEVAVEVKYQVDGFTRFRVQIEEMPKPPRTTTGWVSINSKTFDASSGTSTRSLNFVLGFPTGVSVWDLRVVLFKEPDLIGSSQELHSKEIQIPLGSIASTTTSATSERQQPDPLVVMFAVVIVLTVGLALFISRKQRQEARRTNRRQKPKLRGRQKSLHQCRLGNCFARLDD